MFGSSTTLRHPPWPRASDVGGVVYSKSGCCCCCSRCSSDKYTALYLVEAEEAIFTDRLHNFWDKGYWILCTKGH